MDPRRFEAAATALAKQHSSSVHVVHVDDVAAGDVHRHGLAQAAKVLVVADGAPVLWLARLAGARPGAADPSGRAGGRPAAGRGRRRSRSDLGTTDETGTTHLSQLETRG